MLWKDHWRLYKALALWRIKGNQWKEIEMLTRTYKAKPAIRDKGSQKMAHWQIWDEVESCQEAKKKAIRDERYPGRKKNH